MWKTHLIKSHFQTIHSWLGIVVLTAFTFQFLSAAVVLFLVDNAALRARFIPYHRLVESPSYSVRCAFPF